MSERRRIGLREVRALGPGEIVWDSGLPGFAARRHGRGAHASGCLVAPEGAVLRSVSRHTDFAYFSLLICKSSCCNGKLYIEFGYLVVSPSGFEPETY